MYPQTGLSLTSDPSSTSGIPGMRYWEFTQGGQTFYQLSHRSSLVVDIESRALRHARQALYHWPMYL